MDSLFNDELKGDNIFWIRKGKREVDRSFLDFNGYLNYICVALLVGVLTPPDVPCVHRVFLYYGDMSNKPRVCIYIDGQNLYNAINKRLNFYYSSFSLSEFFDSLVGAHREKIATRYYVGQVKQFNDDPDSKRIYDSQQKTLQKLKSEGIYTVLGRIQKIGKQYREKGVDVKMAIDLVEGFYEDRYDTAIVISADTDLKPVYDMMIQKGKKLELVLFSGCVPVALASNENYTIRVLSDSDLLSFGQQRS